MNNEFFSTHIGNASELTLLADIKPGFVPIELPLTYAARLRGHLRMLSELRRNGLESDRAGVYVGPIDSLQTLQYVRWTLVENDTKMLLAVNFDRPFEPYVRRIVDLAGPLLDTILCHCTGFDGHSSDQGFDVFMDYATRHQVPVELFAAASPNVSVDDGDFYLSMDQNLRKGIAQDDIDTALTKLRIQTPEERLLASRQDSKLALLDQGLNIIRVTYENADRFPNQNDITRDDLLYWRLTNSLVPQFFEGLADGLNDLSGGATLPTSGEDWRKNILIKFRELIQNGPPDIEPAKLRTVARTSELLQNFSEPLRWFSNPAPIRVGNRTIIPPTQDTVQPGLLLESVPAAKIATLRKPFRATHACLLLLRIDDPTGGAAFLEAMDQQIWPEDETGHSLNLSITNAGLKTLNVPEVIRRKFPPAFREGMAERAGLLGDTDCNNPKEWSWPTRNWPFGAPQTPIAPNSIDLILQIEAAPENAPEDPPFDKAHPLIDQITALAALAEGNGVKLLHVEAMQRRQNAAHVQGHMRFVDGISQPDFRPADPASPKMPWDNSELGDLLLGHPTKLDQMGTFPQFPAPLQNGTFQVVRKIRLDVAGFHKQAANIQQTDVAIDAKTVMEKMMGRRMDGSSFATNTADNSFDYDDDQDGEKTPLQSHVRRINARKEETPRILRRGFSYGPFAAADPKDDGVDRGQIFVAYNANIAEQFEVIQRWISGGNNTGISSWHGDPMLAPSRPNGSRAFRFLHDKTAVTVELNQKPIGTLQWGLYAFTPSRNGLRTIASGDYSIAFATDEAKQAGNVGISDQNTKEGWKQFLEDSDDENRHKRDAFWENLRNTGKPVNLGEFGVAVGNAKTVRDILVNKDDTYSVREYRDRMKDTIGVQYLGLDDRDQHDKEQQILGTFLNEDLKEGQMFQDAYAAAKAYLTRLPYETQSLEPDGRNGETHSKPLGQRLESEAFIHAVTAELSVRWLGIPMKEFQLGGPQSKKPHCPRDFLASSYYLFTPEPTEYNKTNAENRTPLAIAELRDFIESESRQPTSPNSLLEKIEAKREADATAKKPEFWTPQKMAEYVAGSCFGLVGPVTGSFRSVLFDWIKEDKLWRLQQQIHEKADSNALDAAIQVLRPAILSSMSERPIADLLFRRTTKDVVVDGQEIDAGRRVVFSQRSAILDSDDAETFLFGGDYSNPSDETMMHKCPGKMMGLAILMGSFSAMMNAGSLWPEGPLSIRIKRL